MKTTKLTLVVEVDYKDNGVPLDELEGMLLSVADKAAGDGLLTGSTPAEVENWRARVEIRRSTRA